MEVKNFLISVIQIVCMVSFAYIHRYSRYYFSFFSGFWFCLTASSLNYFHKNMHPWSLHGKSYLNSIDSQKESDLADNRCVSFMLVDPFFVGSVAVFPSGVHLP